jgi:hypothetical protein
VNKRRALTALAVYYLVTGAWPIVHMRSFEAVTGRKVDLWLVKQVGILTLANSAAMMFGLRRTAPSADTVALGVLSTVAFSIIDITYVVRRRISPVYLADAAVELGFAAVLLVPEEAASH